MHLVLILVICVALLPGETSAAIDDPDWATWAVSLTLLAVLLPALVCERFAAGLVARLRRDPAARPRVLRWYQLGRFAYAAVSIGAYLLTLFALGWAELVRVTWDLKHTVLVDELTILAPFLAALICGWFSFYRVDRALHDSAAVWGEPPFCGRTAYVLFHLRHYLGLVLAPMLLFIAAHDLLALIPLTGVQRDRLEWGALIGLTAAILIFMPWVLTTIWGARPLPPGPLRDRLEAAARRLRFRYTDLLVWNTRGGMANAMVTGILPYPRYVLLSDTLLQHLQPEEIEAVFGHEVGHIKHHHMLLYLGFLTLSVALITAALVAMSPAGGEGWATVLGTWSAADLVRSSHLTAVLLIGGYVWLVFGFLSRRCERQADVYGCKAVSCGTATCQGHEYDNEALRLQSRGAGLCPTGIRTFKTALERVAALNGMPRGRKGFWQRLKEWRHSSIDWRVDFLDHLLADPAAEQRFQRRLLWMKGALLVSLSGLLGMTLWW